MSHSKAYQYVTPHDVNHIVSGYCRALGYPARMIILRWLASEGSKYAGEISDYIQLSKATTSHHLACLAKAGLIYGIEEGSWIRYELNDLNFVLAREYLELVFDEIEAAAGIVRKP